MHHVKKLAKNLFIKKLGRNLNRYFFFQAMGTQLTK